MGSRPKGFSMAALHHLVGGAGGHHLHVHARADHAVHQAHIDDDALVAVVVAVEDQGLERGRPRPPWGRGCSGTMSSSTASMLMPILAEISGASSAGRAEDVLDLVLHPLGVGGGQVDLVHHRQDLQIVLHGKIGVGQGLGLDALGGVHHQHRALAGGQGPGDLIVEVHVARGVDEVQKVGLAVLGLVMEGDGPGLDGDAPLPLQVHVVQQLALHVPLRHGTALFQQPVGQGGFAVVDVGDDGEVADMG